MSFGTHVVPIRSFGCPLNISVQQAWERIKNYSAGSEGGEEGNGVEVTPPRKVRRSRQRKEVDDAAMEVADGAMEVADAEEATFRTNEAALGKGSGASSGGGAVGGLLFGDIDDLLPKATSSKKRQRGSGEK